MWWRTRGRSSGAAKGVGQKRRPSLELRTKREVDNFCCSHRCTSDVQFGQERVGALTSARSATSLGWFSSFRSTALTPVVLGLVFPSLLHIIDSPETNLNAAERLNWRRLDLPQSYPAMKSR